MSGRRRRLLIATGSAHKLAELRELLELPHSDLVALADVSLSDDAPETGDSFEDNATSKALYYAGRSGLPTLADDSGLEVDALDGLPGVRTRRFAHEEATDDENNRHLLERLAGVEPAARTARYRCVLVFAEPAGEGGVGVSHVTTGMFEGRVALEPRGEGGFGYDPIFEPADEQPGGRTVGQLSIVEKNAISHRAQAARAMGQILRRRGY